MNITINPVTHENMNIFNRLNQACEYELSSTTQKFPDRDGRFSFSTKPDKNHIGYLGFREETPFGFSIIRKTDYCKYEVRGFFIIPVFRKRGLGYSLAAELFNIHRGTWEIKQAPAANSTIDFWRKVIRQYTLDNFAEDKYQDPYEGVVIRQAFRNSITS